MNFDLMSAMFSDTIQETLADGGANLRGTPDGIVETDGSH
jgi:hypothetical protein